MGTGLVSILFTSSNKLENTVLIVTFVLPLENSRMVRGLTLDVIESHIDKRMMWDEIWGFTSEPDCPNLMKRTQPIYW